MEAPTGASPRVGASKWRGEVCGSSHCRSPPWASECATTIPTSLIIEAPVHDQRDIDLPGPPPVTAAERRRVIAVIGIGRYQNWDRLSNAVNDAMGARHLFQKLGFEEVTRPLLDEEATGEAINSLVTDELATLDPHDSLVLFYAGHGGNRDHVFEDRTIKSGFLLPVDAANAANKVATWIELEGWLRKVSRLPPKHILVILDACYSGIALDSAVERYRDGASPEATPLSTLSARRSRRVITSALPEERALDGGPVEGNSLFTGYLIEGLEVGLMRDGRREATGSRIGEYVQRRVREHTNARQTPDFGPFALDARGEMVIPLVDGAQRTDPFATTVPRGRMPLDVVANLKRPESWVRVPAVMAVAELLRDERPDVAREACEHLEQLVLDDSPQVAEIARSALSGPATELRGPSSRGRRIELAFRPVVTLVLVLTFGGLLGFVIHSRNLDEPDPGRRLAEADALGRPGRAGSPATREPEEVEPAGPANPQAIAIPDIRAPAAAPPSKPGPQRVTSEPAREDVSANGRRQDVKTPADITQPKRPVELGRVGPFLREPGQQAEQQEAAPVGTRFGTDRTTEDVVGLALARARKLETDRLTARTKARELHQEATRQFNLGRWQRAIDVWTESYDVFPHPEFLFNIAKAHQQNGDCRRALFFYDRYLAQYPSATNARYVNQLIDALNQECPSDTRRAPTEVDRDRS
jgi:uncharacterized caspase-like protein